MESGAPESYRFVIPGIYPCHQNDYMQLFMFSGINFLRCFPLEPFFEINLGILCSGIGSEQRLIALNSG